MIGRRQRAAEPYRALIGRRTNEQRRPLFKLGQHGGVLVDQFATAICNNLADGQRSSALRIPQQIGIRTPAGQSELIGVLRFLPCFPARSKQRCICRNFRRKEHHTSAQADERFELFGEHICRQRRMPDDERGLIPFDRGGLCRWQHLSFINKTSIGRRGRGQSQKFGRISIVGHDHSLLNSRFRIDKRKDTVG